MESIGRRLRKLEQRYPPPGKPSPMNVKRTRRRVAILASMTPEYRAILDAEYAGYRQALERVDTVAEALDQVQFSNLFWAVETACSEGGPAAMPPEVARVYLEDPDALPLHDCEDCGFSVPLRTGHCGVPARRYFDSCPLCGGSTGYTAFYLKHGHRPTDPTESSIDA